MWPILHRTAYELNAARLHSASFVLWWGPPIRWQAERGNRLPYFILLCLPLLPARQCDFVTPMPPSASPLAPLCLCRLCLSGPTHSRPADPPPPWPPLYPLWWIPPTAPNLTRSLGAATTAGANPPPDTAAVPPLPRATTRTTPTPRPPLSSASAPSFPVACGSDSTKEIHFDVSLSLTEKEEFT
jgi:hypothetical protein